MASTESGQHYGGKNKKKPQLISSAISRAFLDYFVRGFEPQSSFCLPRAKWWPSISFSSAIDLIDLITDTEFNRDGPDQGKYFYSVLSTQLTDTETSRLLVLEVRRPGQ